MKKIKYNWKKLLIRIFGILLGLIVFVILILFGNPIYAIIFGGSIIMISFSIKGADEK